MTLGINVPLTHSTCGRWSTVDLRPQHISAQLHKACMAPKHKAARSTKVEPAGAPAEPTTPFPGRHAHLVQQQARAVLAALESFHGLTDRKAAQQLAAEQGISCGCDLGPAPVLDSLVRTILSQNTTDITSSRAFASLKAAFPAWEEVRTAPQAQVAQAIRVGGLADIKAQRIQAILETLHAEKGKVCLEYLRSMTNDQAKQELQRFKGVGPKTIACVLMFNMERHEFPVDTHVLHIARKLGWLPSTASRETAYMHLNALVPDDIKYDLHVLMVEHGKKCCRLSGTVHKAASKVPSGKAQSSRAKQQGGGEDAAMETVVLQPPSIASFAMQGASGLAGQEAQGGKGRAAKRRRTEVELKVEAVVQEVKQEQGSVVLVKEEGVDVKQESEEAASAVPGPVLPDQGVTVAQAPGLPVDAADSLGPGLRRQCPLQVFYTGSWSPAAALTPG